MRTAATYVRVIPRDLFNEASLLKCLGRLWIETERYQPHVSIEHDGGPFEIEQNENDGSISVSNVRVTIDDIEFRHWRPLNSRQDWPLYIEVGEAEIRVFDDSGELSRDMLELI